MDVFIDTGTINYTIQDSILLADTAIGWTILEHATLFQGWLSADSLTPVESDKTLTLFESTVYQHPLICNGIVWNFPSDAAYTVDRFADSAHRTTIAGTDTLWFSDTAGYIARSAYFHTVFSPFSSNKAYIHANLLDQTAVSVASEVSNPLEFRLEQNYPNPFNPSTRIRFKVPIRGRVTLTVYDILGQRIASFVDHDYLPGSHEILFDGSGLPSGIYLFQLRLSDLVQSRKMILLK